jgi:hypothetical protein
MLRRQRHTFGGEDHVVPTVEAERAARPVRSLILRNIRWLITKLMSSVGPTSKGAHRRAYP